MTVKQALKTINSKIPYWLTPTKRVKGNQYYLCPVCKRGDLIKNPKTGKYKCFVCNSYPKDIFNLWQIWKHHEHNVKGAEWYNDLQACCRYFNIQLDNECEPKRSNSPQQITIRVTAGAGSGYISPLKFVDFYEEDYKQPVKEEEEEETEEKETGGRNNDGKRNTETYTTQNSERANSSKVTNTRYNNRSRIG